MRLYEGYFFPKSIGKRFSKSLKKRQRRGTKKIRLALKHKNEFMSGKANEFKKLYRDDALMQYKNIERIFPIQANLLMPTRFGNILLTSELYPEEKYAMNSIALWTRLIHVMPKHFKDLMEEKNNQLIFLLNSSLLSYLISFISFAVAILGLPCQIFVGAYICASVSSASPFYLRGFLQVAPSEYLLVGILFAFIGYFVYWLSLPTAEAFGLLVRSGFDLYRFDLLHQMNYKLPKNSEEEKNLWRGISEYMISGNKLQLREPDPIEYSVRKELLNKVEGTPDDKSK